VISAATRQVSNSAYLRNLLGVYLKGPRDHGTAEQPDELTSLHPTTS
jgi:hypothetical protein